MIKKIVCKLTSRLAVKVFLLTAVLMAACCGMMYACMVRFAPYVYKHQVEEAEELAVELSLCMGECFKEEAVFYIREMGGILKEQTEDEFVFVVCNSSGDEIDIRYWNTFAGREDGWNGDQAAAAKEHEWNESLSEGGHQTVPGSEVFTGRNMEEWKGYEQTGWYPIWFADSTEEYFLLAVQNMDKESQVVEALHKAFPILAVVVGGMSFMASFFYTWYVTAPMKKISSISRKMAEMDFSCDCPLRRTDEIGVLSDSLNALSVKLSAALLELQEANQKLQADIDKERQLERQRSEFFSAASHELKTPITIIKGQLEGMLYQVGRYKDRETYLAGSLEEVCVLEKMVQELLTISRLGTPGYMCHKCLFDFGSLIKQRLEAYEDLFMLKELELKPSVEAGVMVAGDRWLLEKAVDNLFSNAAAYSPPKNHVQVKLWKEAEKIWFAVENTGVHIPEEKIPKLFEAFYRLEPSRSRQTGGSGLGLYIVNTILKLHGAEITVANNAQGVEVLVQFGSDIYDCKNDRYGYNIE
ncbi:MAG: HAMP domain-containing histidine kinase [Eubacterium sp.]|nr:HAMP domain-containing histidine kinase [Eubacterium sp.]